MNSSDTIFEQQIILSESLFVHDYTTFYFDPLFLPSLVQVL